MDFHALRTAYINLILDYGALPREAMDLARHSDLKMTMNVYARSRPAPRSELTEQLGDSILPEEAKVEESEKDEYLTGTYPEKGDSESARKSEAFLVRGGGIEPPWFLTIRSLV